MRASHQCIPVMTRPLEPKPRHFLTSPEPPPTLLMPAACCLAKMADLGLRLQAGPCHRAASTAQTETLPRLTRPACIHPPPWRSLPRQHGRSRPETCVGPLSRAAFVPRVSGVAIAPSTRSGRTKAWHTRSLTRPIIGNRQDPRAPPLAPAIISKRPKKALWSCQVNPSTGIGHYVSALRPATAP